MSKKAIVLLAYVAAVLLAILALVYFTTPANHLPSFLPGHDTTVTKTHMKHGIAALLLALGCVALGWFQGGPKSSQNESTPE